MIHIHSACNYDKNKKTKMIYKLCTKPPQFVTGKTEVVLCDIWKRIEKIKLNNDNDIDNETDNDNDSDNEKDNGNDSDDNKIHKHTIDIIVTNNSLVEAEQWKCRLVSKVKEYRDVKFHILSSKSNDFTDINTYINGIQQVTDENDLPNVLIVCYNAKRVCSDIITLCNTFGGLHKMILPNILKKHIVNFNISFDEPDANLGVTQTFLTSVKPFIINNTITGVLFITATSTPQFWAMLNRCGIIQLYNLNKDTTNNYDEDLESYICFKDHNIILHNNNTTNPLLYIMDLFCTKKIDETSRKIIFAPGHLYTEKRGVGSHVEIEKFFLTKDYTVVKMNSAFKGFVHPGRDDELFEDYNKKHGIKGELRETLAHFAENNKETNIVITGNSVIERGVTFNTINFNFTDMILSDYHRKSKSKLNQLAGRGAGGKQYVGKMNIFCTDDVKNDIEMYIEKMNQICSANPESFNRTDFNINKNTIPVKIEINNIGLLNNLIELTTKSKKGYKLTVHQLLIEGIRDGCISIYDNNNSNKFNINLRSLKGVRMYKEGQKKEVRRFQNFNDAFEKLKTTSQTGDGDEYNIDFAKDTYEFNGYVNQINVWWITFKYK